MTGVLIGREEDAETHGGKNHVKMEAEVGVTLSRAKDHQEPLEDERRRKDPPLEPSEGLWWLHSHLDFRLLAPNTGME